MIETISTAFRKVFGTRNDRLIKAYSRRVAAINALEPKVRLLDDAQLKAKTVEFRKRIKDGEPVASVMPEAMAVARETMDRAVGLRSIFNPAHNFDVTLLPAELRPLYQQIAAKAAEIPPVAERGCVEPVPGWMQVDIPTEMYEAVRVLFPKSRPPFRARPFDVQLIGGMVLSEGRISEMKTGEGKTIVAPLACYVACLENLHCHVVTVNDYLVQRDRDWVFPFYYHLGVQVGAIHPFHMQSNEAKQEAYTCDVVYGTNSEFGFDYLRDNMKMSAPEQVQKQRDFVIIDEVDSILIDEARTPLIISGPAHDDQPRYDLADKLARHLIGKQREWDAADAKVQQTLMRIKGLEGDIRNTRDKDAIPRMRTEMKDLQTKLPELEAARNRHTQYYEVEREKKATHLTHDGVAEAQKVANIGSFYVGSNMDMPHLLENALRAHVVYQLDKEYMVNDEGEVIIIDEFTGRAMIGRQWSDGLHQAVEAKEKVKIKQETQTLATVTIQNFFKLYKRRAGMTGTAITEAQEFSDIYKLDVVCIPTNVAVVRIDRDDLIFLSEDDKWEAILDEIKKVHDIGRPVLVGTTSVENSQMLSNRLTRKYNIKHEVLNARQHEREAQIVAHAGELGAVMIATNMAGRGTDIKLSPIDRAAIVRHWQLRNILPREATPELDDKQLVNLAYQHMAKVTFGLKADDADVRSPEAARLRLLRHWVANRRYNDGEDVAKLTDDQCVALLDREPEFLWHRLSIFQHVEEMGGLHIVGTERHESRRIDNQLRGRSGRQGDRGSTRFFISLGDPLMKLFAGPATLTALSKLGMKQGDAIEHRWITKSVQRAQRKVEERNFESRKVLLEYDEVMEHQRKAFYGVRQAVIEGRNIERIIFDYIGDAVEDSVNLIMDRDYVPTQIAEWCRQAMEVSIEPHKLRTSDLKDLQQIVSEEARAEVRETITVTLGEYMSADVLPDDWDLNGLAAWAKNRFAVDLEPSRLREMNPDQIHEAILHGAIATVEKKELGDLAKFLDPQYAAKDLAEWTKQKFGFTIDPAKLIQDRSETTQAFRARLVSMIVEQARAEYLRREMLYPIEFMIEMVFQAAQSDGKWAATELASWANQRYELGWTAETVAKTTGKELTDQLTSAAEEWLRKGKLDAMVDKAIADNGNDPVKLVAWCAQRLGRKVALEDLEDEHTRRYKLIYEARAMLRTELTQLERFVLLQILDTAWKDHLYGMDQLKDGIHMRAYAEKDPRIEYKREGSNLFGEMQRSVRDRVTELIFRVKLNLGAELRSVYAAQKAEHAEAQSLAAAVEKTAAEERKAAGPSGEGEGEPEAPMSRKQRRAAAAMAGQEDEAKKEKDRKQFKERRRR